MSLRNVDPGSCGSSLGMLLIMGPRVQPAIPRYMVRTSLARAAGFAVRSTHLLLNCVKPAFLITRYRPVQPRWRSRRSECERRSDRRTSRRGRGDRGRFLGRKADARAAALRAAFHRELDCLDALPFSAGPGASETGTFSAYCVRNSCAYLLLRRISTGERREFSRGSWLSDSNSRLWHFEFPVMWSQFL